MTDRERSQDVEEEQADSADFGTLTQNPEGGGDTTPGENDPPIISSGG